ncbi:MlaA family lipoprotein [Desulfotalea psychrophila]|uniref:VacJ lipoprotein n=1 Tax=Desulfotalea psychrophila (strain LSv54 / DSM 12343) TaxID=177439 RepID=Q6AQI9_DESPS|nr:VacJ family lipoprotein [Desulfotalea psychrophila]CAG35384.1 conserved hypothetical protein [Desulfotalea psychrophila LSv54]
MINNIRYQALSLLLLFPMLLAGCAQPALTEQTAKIEPPMAPMYPINEYVKPDVVYVVDDVYDPLEGFNRSMYTFNYYFDKYLFLPVVNGYEFITPNYVEDRVSCFVDNILEFNNFINNFFQLDPKGTGITLLRFVVNSTVGIGGFWNPATDMGLLRQTENFGQTLGHYGVGNGPYLVLPVLGPSNLRDTAGFGVDLLAFGYYGPPAWISETAWGWSFVGVAAIDRRHRQSFRYYQSGSPFEYEMIRMLYTTKREIEISE